eukprot:Nitzschia sp. Nitz4//scaffold18_size181773//15432//16421//NITZ4_001893-RA/size181773-processed-gene-0.218-mRNA-1//-1//CDS//3329539945//306//frame0
MGTSTNILGKSVLLLALTLTVVLLTSLPSLERCPDVSTAVLDQAPSSRQQPASSSISSTVGVSSLASTQSFGFFDDIPDGTWKQLQEYHSAIFPNHANNIERNMGDKDKSPKWYNDNFHPEFQCQLLQRIPLSLKGDGAKWVCDPHRLRKKPDCLVYSVGSNGETSFEQGIRDVIGENCEIHTFDLVSQNKFRGDFATNLQGISTFHPWGLGTEDQAQKNPKRFQTLAQTMARLGHTNRTIDIFKIDCEGCEWSTVQDWLQQDLRQILVETHAPPLSLGKDFFYLLHDAGYVIYSKEPNLIVSGHCVEYGFLKLSLDFFNQSFYKTNSV